MFVPCLLLALAAAHPSAAVTLAGEDAGAVRTPSSAQAWGGERNAPERVADYRIEAVLDPAAHTVEATERLTWRNRSDVPIATLYFHLYLNAFEGPGSTFNVEGKRYGGPHSGVDAKEGEWGWIELRRIEQGGTPLRWSYVQPDGGPGTDRTVARVELAEPVPPGGSAQIDIEFHDRLPRVVARSGYFGAFHMVAQWFPKVGVLELPGERGATQVRWNCHEYHFFTEFYADFGRYDVSVVVPKGYAVGAVGEQQGPPEETARGMRHRFLQDDVHDFAFAAWDKFETLAGEYEGAGGTRVALKVLYPSEYADAARVSLEATRDALEYFSRTLGPYPYRTLTVVVPPYNAMDAGGMEYETFFTGLGLKGEPLLRFVREAAIHELGHGYFMGLLASNEAEEPLLDEGLDEFWGARFGAEAPIRLQVPALGRLGFPWLDLSAWEYERLGGTPRFPADPIAGNAWRRYSNSSYGLVYHRSALVFHDLERRLGGDALARGFREYYRRWKFRHPSTADLRAALEEATGQKELVDRWFEEQVYSAQAIDDRVESVDSEEVLPKPGTAIREGRRVELDSQSVEKEIREAREAFRKAHPATGPAEPGPFPWRTVVKARRYGASVPQTLAVRFEDGSEERLRWEAEERWHRWELVKPVRASSAQLDPGREVLLDVQKLDDGRLREPRKLGSTRWALEIGAWAQALLALVAAL